MARPSGGGPAAGVDRAQHGEERPGLLQGPGRRRVEERQLRRLGAPHGQLQGQAGQVDAGDLRARRRAGGRRAPASTTAGRRRPGRCARPGRPAARPRPGRWARCAAWSGRCGRRSGACGPRRESTTTRTPSTVRLVSAMSVASTTRRRPGGDGRQGRVLLGRRRQGAEQRPHVDVGREASSRPPPPAGCRPRRAGTPARRRPPPAPPAGRRPSVAASRRSLGRRGTHRTVTSWARPSLSIDRRVAEQGRHLGRLQRGRHGQQAEVGPQRRPGVEDEGQGQVGVEVALVELVEDHQADAGQRRVVLEPAGEDALGHHLDPGRPARPGARRGSCSRRSPRPPRPAATPSAGPRPGSPAGGAPARRCARRPATARPAAAGARSWSCRRRAAPPAPPTPASASACRSVGHALLDGQVAGGDDHYPRSAAVNSEIRSRFSAPSWWRPSLRSITHRAPTSVRPPLPQVPGRQHDLAAGRHDVLDDQDPPAGDLRPLGQLGRAVLLRLLAHERRRQPRRQRQGGGHRHAAQLEAGEHLGAGRDERHGGRRHLPQQLRVGLEQVLVEVRRRHLARAQGERAGQPARLPDAAGQVGQVGGGHGPTLPGPSVPRPGSVKNAPFPYAERWLAAQSKPT